MRTIFITGTGTEVGKTYIAAEIAKSHLRQGTKVGVYKPVASGCIGADKVSSEQSQIQSDGLFSEDAYQLWQAAGRPLDLDAVCPLRFKAPLAPTAAAKKVGKIITVEQMVAGALRWQDECDLLIVEGAGGLFSPIADGSLNLDLANSLMQTLGVVELYLVASNRLGVIHDVLATFKAAEANNQIIQRLYLSSATDQLDESVQSNASTIQSFLPNLEIFEVAFEGSAQPVYRPTQ